MNITGLYTKQYSKKKPKVITSPIPIIIIAVVMI